MVLWMGKKMPQHSTIFIDKKLKLLHNNFVNLLSKFTFNPNRSLGFLVFDNLF